MDAQPGLGAARPRRARGVRHRTAVSRLARPPAADRRLSGAGREGELRERIGGRPWRSQAWTDPHGVRLARLLIESPRRSMSAMQTRVLRKALAKRRRDRHFG